MSIAKKVNPTRVFILILLLQTCLMVAKGYDKEFFHFDEALTFTLANNKDGANISDSYKNTWRPGIDYYRLLTVSPVEKFNYKQVYINQEKDVHPPLYYFIIHTVSSFFPYEFSKWFGIIPNITFFLFTQFFIFLTTNTILKSQTKALVPCILYGFSLGAISSVEFIRMYAMTTMFFMASLYINCRIIYKDFRNINLIFLFLINISGYMTHYYFIVFSFFICLFTNIYLYNTKYIIKYDIVNILAVIMLPILYPASLSHIFSGYRGVEAFQNIVSTPFLSRLDSFYKIIDKHLFSKMISYFIIFCIIYLFIKLAYIIKIKGYSALPSTLHKNLSIFISTKTVQITILLCAISICPFLLLSKIAAFIDFRYISPLYPVFAIITSILIITFYEKHIFTKIAAIFFCTAIILSGVISEYKVQYKNYTKTFSLITKEKDIFIIDLSPHKLLFSNLLPVLNPHSNIYITTKDTTKNFFDIVNNHMKNKTTAGIYVLYHMHLNSSEKNSIVSNLKNYNIETRDIEFISCIKIERQNNMLINDNSSKEKGAKQVP